MKSHTWKEIWRYRFDNFMARGGSSIFVSLLLMFIGSWIALGLLRVGLHLLYPAGAAYVDGMFGHLWYVFLQLTDPGAMVTDIPAKPAFKVITIATGLVGVVIFSMLIAFITTQLEQKMAYLRKGHSAVIEDDHTLILGWNDRLVEIIRELEIANESEPDSCVVVLAERDKEWMDDFLELHLGDTGKTRVVTRSGNISSLVHLEKVAVRDTRSIIVLASCTDMANDTAKAASDAKLIKCVLALKAVEGREEPWNIVAEIFSPRNRQILQDIASEQIVTVNTGNILAKILVQTSRSSGLSVVYTELLSFDGVEMYFHNDPRWKGLTYGVIQFHFPDGVPIGLRRGDNSLLINPAADTEMAEDDDVLIIAEDDSTIEFRSEPVAIPEDWPLKEGRLTKLKERNLILGWNAKAATVVREYESYVLEDSDVVVMIKEATPVLRSEIYGLQNSLTAVNLYFIEEDPMNIEQLLEIKPFTFDNIVILSQKSEEIDAETTDSETIILLLLLREIFAKHADEAKNTKLITEVMDSENQELVSRAGVNDFIISNRFVSMIFAQISEERDIKRVYDDLFDEEGSEIYLKPASLYFDHLPATLTFADMMGIAQKRQEVCIGVKLKRLEKEIRKNFGVKLIPDKNTQFRIEEHDSLIVVSEDET